MNTAPPLNSFAPGPGPVPAGISPGPPAEPVDPQLVQETRAEIRKLVAEIAQLSQGDQPLAEYCAEFLGRVVSAMAAVGGAVWVCEGNEPPQLAYEINLPRQEVFEGDAPHPAHLQLLAKVARAGQPVLAPPRAAAVDELEPGNPTELLIIAAPVLVEGAPQAIVEVFQRPGAGPTTQRGYQRFVAQMCDLAGEFLRNRRLRQLHEREALWRQLEQFVAATHRTLDLTETAFALVNEGRRLVQCDRVSLALFRGRRCEVRAVSGLDNVDRRAAQAASLARLVERVAAAGEPLWHAESAREHPPQIESALQEYVDRSHARLVAVLPLARPAAERARPEWLGALVIEQLTDDHASEGLRSRAELVAQHGAAALGNALEHHRLFLLPVWKALGQWTWALQARRLPWTLAIAGTLVCIAAALALVPADLEIACRGKLQPALRREIFAPLGGVVVEVPVRHGELVAPGQLLARLENTDLALEITQLLGRQTTTDEQLSTHQRMLLESSRGQGARLTPAEENRLAGELLQLRQEAETIARELALLREKESRLTVAAPQRGQVLSWKVEDYLLRRPVQQGQALLTLADPAGPWELELYVPERRMRHVDAAAAEESLSAGRPPLEVTFQLASHPGQEFRGRVLEIERKAEVRGEDGNSVLARVAIAKEELPQLRSETTVAAKVYCGRQPLGYVWFCDLIETVQAKVLFWL